MVGLLVVCLVNILHQHLITLLSGHFIKSGHSTHAGDLLEKAKRNSKMSCGSTFFCCGYKKRSPIGIYFGVVLHFRLYINYKLAERFINKKKKNEIKKKNK